MKVEIICKNYRLDDNLKNLSKRNLPSSINILTTRQKRKLSFLPHPIYSKWKLPFRKDRLSFARSLPEIR